MIRFRLSARDYERLREFHVTRGARSISELARSAASALTFEAAIQIGTGVAIYRR